MILLFLGVICLVCGIGHMVINESKWQYMFGLVCVCTGIADFIMAAKQMMGG